MLARLAADAGSVVDDHGRHDQADGEEGGVPAFIHANSYCQADDNRRVGARQAAGLHHPAPVHLPLPVRENERFHDLCGKPGGEGADQWTVGEEVIHEGIHVAGR